MLTPEREAQLREWAFNDDFNFLHGRKATRQLFAEIDRLRSTLATVEAGYEMARKEVERMDALLATAEREREEERRLKIALRDSVDDLWEQHKSILAEIDRLRAEKAALEEQVRANVRHAISLEKAGEGLINVLHYTQGVDDSPILQTRPLRRWREATSSGAVKAGELAPAAPDTIAGISRADLHRPLGEMR